MEAPARGFAADTVETVVQQAPRKVDSLGTWGSYLLAGLSDGSLLIYKQQEFVGEGSARWQVRACSACAGLRLCSAPPAAATL